LIIVKIFISLQYNFNTQNFLFL